jgi:2-polyprenyl-3-methyl-5-hydroxy-6-metoxy-1,4-benzoquinol methylase
MREISDAALHNISPAETVMPPGYYGEGRQEMLSFVPARRARVLEIGCGEGRFSGALTGVEESWGIEPSPAAEVAKHRLTRVLQATFDEAESELPVNFFDLVICNDVIEHLPDHASFLSRIGKYITPDGMIIGSIPNVRFYNNMFEYLLEKDWHYTDSGVLDRTHLTFFTEKSLRNALERHGFKVLRLQGINSWHRFSRTARSSAYRGIALALMVMTLGYFADIRHLQFAFQATPRKT